MTATVMEKAPLRELSVTADRCDRCGAQAFVRVVVTASGSELLFCGHHYHENESALNVDTYTIEDHRPQINTAPSTSANAA